MEAIIVHAASTRSQLFHGATNCLVGLEQRQGLFRPSPAFARSERITSAAWLMTALCRPYNTPFQVCVPGFRDPQHPRQPRTRELWG